jgi:hypothetical protein
MVAGNIPRRPTFWVGGSSHRRRTEWREDVERPVRRHAEGHLLRREAILKALPKMARAAQSEEGKAGFLKHRAETESQVERLVQVFEIIGKPARGKTCKAIHLEGEDIWKSSRALPHSTQD